jgi:hypothetical protein
MVISRGQMSKQLEPGLGNKDFKRLRSYKKDAWHDLQRKDQIQSQK